MQKYGKCVNNQMGAIFVSGQSHLKLKKFVFVFGVKSGS
jgi:hypothetical protein